MLSIFFISFIFVWLVVFHLILYICVLLPFHVCGGGVCGSKNTVTLLPDNDTNSKSFLPSSIPSIFFAFFSFCASVFFFYCALVLFSFSVTKLIWCRVYVHECVCFLNSYLFFLCFYLFVLFALVKRTTEENTSNIDNVQCYNRISHIPCMVFSCFIFDEINK